MTFDDLINFLKYTILRQRPQLSYEKYMEYKNNFNWYYGEDEMSGESARSLGKSCFKQMVELNKTIKLLQNKIKRKLPDYLKENLEEIQVAGKLDNISLQFHFKNYNKMNKKLVNEIRSDFASCIQTDKLPDYQIKFADTHFILIFYIEDYL